MKRTDTVVIGGGQAGLAMSHHLSERGIDHVVLERGRVGERWRSERWDSLRLLTPRWQCRLPGVASVGADPHGFMTIAELIAYLERYARNVAAPVHDETTVLGVARTETGYRVTTDRGVWLAPNVVIATGHSDRAHVPVMARHLSSRVLQVVPTRYRNPDGLPDGGVLVVGASATGVQLADEIRESGRDVTLAVGRHIRLPRRYRGHDILLWLSAMGVLDQRTEEIPFLEQARRQPSMQLVGRPDHRSIDLDTLRSSGVHLVGKALAISGEHVRFADDLEERAAHADAKLTRILDRVDEFAEREGWAVSGPTRPRPIRVAATPRTLDLRSRGITTVLWATGFRRSYPWLSVPVLDERGELAHRGGITAAPGLYALGLPLLRHRSSSFIGGVGADAGELALHIHDRLNRRSNIAA